MMMLSFYLLLAVLGVIAYLYARSTRRRACPSCGAPLS
jgi:hypothetical protein